MFRLNRNKQDTNRNSLIGSIFCYFLQKKESFSDFYRFFSRIFSVFSVCFETVCFGCFASIPKQRVLIEPKQTEDPQNSIFGNFSKNLGLFRFVSVCYETDLFVSVVSI